MALKKWALGIGVVALVVGGIYFSWSPTNENALLTKQSVMAKLFKIPLRFEKNVGQIDDRVKYLTRGSGYSFFFTPSEIVMTLKQPKEDNVYSVVKMQFIGANQNPTITGLDEQLCKSNYFIGSDPAKWHTDIPNFSKVSYQNLYLGIDAIFYGNPHQLEYDISVAPGANPKTVQLYIEGSQELAIDDTGNLHIITDAQDVTMQRPFVYQIKNGEKISIESQFVLLAENAIGFEVAAYDTTKTLIIDPILQYSTYLGGTDSFGGNLMSIAVDSSGSAYVTGRTGSTDFPVKNWFQMTLVGDSAATVTKLTPAGNALVYSTYLGGAGGDSGGNGIAIDSTGSAYVTGFTTSPNFPVLNAAQVAYGGVTDAFVTRFTPEGNALIFSTYLGGTNFDTANGIALDLAGNAFISGETTSEDFPVLNALQPIYGAGSSNQAFVAKYSLIGTKVFATFLGGTASSTSSTSIAVDSNGSPYVTGFTTALDFPTTPGAFQTILIGLPDAFVTKYTPDGQAYLYSTYLGGTLTQIGRGIAVDNNGSAYVTGDTNSPDFPVLNAFQPTISALGNLDAFVTKFNPAGSGLVYSTYLGGSLGDTSSSSIAVDGSQNAYLTGATSAPNFPQVQPIQSFGGLIDVFITKFNASGTALIYSTFLGGFNFEGGFGIAVDSAGSAYITGSTISTNFPLVNPFQSSLPNENNSGFVSKLASIQPPSNVRGARIANRFLIQTDYINVLTWQANATGSPAVEYRIYRDQQLTKLIATVPATGPLVFKDHNRKKNKTYTYFIVAVDQLGNVSSVVSVTVPPRG